MKRLITGLIFIFGAVAALAVDQAELVRNTILHNVTGACMNCDTIAAIRYDGRHPAKDYRGIIQSAIDNVSRRGGGVVSLSGGIYNVVMEDCDVAGYCKLGFYLTSNPDRGGYVQNVYVRNCHFGEVEDLFYINNFCRYRKNS